MDAQDFPPDYDQRIERVCDAAALALRKCRGDLPAQLRACSDYFNHGDAEGVSHGEIVDFLGVSSPSVLDRAGYSNEEVLRVMEGIRLIELDSAGRSIPPTSLPSSKAFPKENQSSLGLGR